MEPFLKADYEVPKPSGNYTKLEDGANKLRILTAPVMGYLYWNNKGKSVRSREAFKTLPEDIRYREDARTGDSKPEKPKHFWVMVVYNYALKAIQILEITQGTIQSQLVDLVQNEAWGDPRTYDITINRKGERFDTEYNVLPSPATPLDEDIRRQFENMRIDLDALFEAKDPFGGTMTEEEKQADEDFANVSSATITPPTSIAAEVQHKNA